MTTVHYINNVNLKRKEISDVGNVFNFSVTNENFLWSSESQK